MWLWWILLGIQGASFFHPLGLGNLLFTHDSSESRHECWIYIWKAVMRIIGWMCMAIRIPCKFFFFFTLSISLIHTVNYQILITNVPYLLLTWFFSYPMPRLTLNKAVMSKYGWPEHFSLPTIMSKEKYLWLGSLLKHMAFPILLDQKLSQ